GPRKLSRRERARPRTPEPAEAEAVARATPGSQGIQRVLAASGLAPATAGNDFELITDGVRAFETLLALIAAAKRSVHLSYFILSDDDAGRAVLDALVARARAGVEVRVLLDAVGSRTMLRRARRQLKPVGGRVRALSPLLRLSLRDRPNLRSHRKLVILDGAT